MASPATDDLPDVSRLRKRASHGFAALFWLQAPVVGFLASSTSDCFRLVLIASLLAAIVTMVASFRPAASATRLLIAFALTVMPIVSVFAGGGSSQANGLIYYFVAFAMLAIFCDWRPIVLSATLAVVGQSLLGSFDGTQAALVVAECALLLRVVAQLHSFFRDAAHARELEEEKSAAENAERGRVQERLMQAAFHDDLTGLRSRSYFTDALEDSMDRSKRDPSYLFALLYIDLDRFKIVNDRLGHLVGDELLVGIAERLRTVLRSGDTLARMGGDEFTLLLDNVPDPKSAAAVAQRIGDLLAQPFLLSGNEVFGTASIGIAYSATGYARADAIVHDADCAMYEAKRRGSGRGGYAIFETSMDAKASIASALQHDLRQALERGEFFLHYQPIVRLESERIVGFEALVRWQHPTRGLIAPSEFVALAEETGSILAIGNWILREACRQMQEWDAAYGSRLSCMSVNLSSRQIEHPDFARDVDDILEATNLAPHRLQLEITESALLGDVAGIGATLARLRSRGIRVAFDDFGIGYSSLSHLQRYRVDTLKVDQSFVRGLEYDVANVEIVQAIVALARTLKVNVDAEGVETAEQRYAVAALGCTSAQGYYFSEAVPAVEVPALLRADARKGSAAVSNGGLEYATLSSGTVTSLLLRIKHPETSVAYKTLTGGASGSSSDAASVSPSGNGNSSSSGRWSATTSDPPLKAVTPRISHPCDPIKASVGSTLGEGSSFAVS